MLSREDNERVTRVGRGTPMGELMRRYWIPALLGWELPEPDGPPVRVRLLGEDLVAFRDTHGRIGLLDEHCPHRRVSLFFGRNEDCGLRCVYHGWKFDVDGQCVDMMNEPESFAHKISTNSYPTAEGGGVIWAYMGPPELRPPLPHFVWTQVAPTHLMVSKVIQETNWLQGLEGGIDTSHAPILHRVLGGGSSRSGFQPSDPFVRGKAPTLELDVTEYGYRYAGLRQLHDGAIHVRAYHFILPFHQIRPGRTGPGKDYSGVAGHIWVPVDDDNTVVFNWEYSTTDPLTDEDRLERRLGNGPFDVDQATFRSRRNRENNYLLDRKAQKTRELHGHRGHQHPGSRRPGEHGAHRRPEPRTSGARGPRGDPGAPPAASGHADRRERRHAPRRRADLLRAPAGRGPAARRRRLAAVARAGAPDRGPAAGVAPGARAPRGGRHDHERRFISAVLRRRVRADGARRRRPSPRGGGVATARARGRVRLEHRAARGAHRWVAPVLRQRLSRRRVALGKGPDVDPANQDTWIPWLRKSADRYVELIKDTPEEWLNRRVDTIDTPGATLSGWRLLMMMVEHEVHHRSQIDTYAGLHGWPVPQIFNRSAESIDALQAEQRHKHAVKSEGASTGPSEPPQEGTQMQIEKDVAMTTRDGDHPARGRVPPGRAGPLPGAALAPALRQEACAGVPATSTCSSSAATSSIMQDTRGPLRLRRRRVLPADLRGRGRLRRGRVGGGAPVLDGQVGTMGQSYLGATQYLLAPTRPPHLRASFPASAPSDFHQ